jgi:murein DD-endopeptidase MepM/ murein hydrolase activator NlpD
MADIFSDLTQTQDAPQQTLAFPTLQKIKIKPLANPIEIAPVQISDTIDKKIESYRQAMDERIKKAKTIGASSVNSTLFDGSDPASEFDAFRQSIAQKESSGKYSAISPKNNDGDYAYGKYQIKGSNIPSWTKEVLGKSMTPQEFLQNADAQEKVFQTKTMQNYQKYGNWEDVASVWFSGRPVNKAGNSADVTGYTVPQYVRDTMALMRGFAKFKPVKEPAVGNMIGTLGVLTTQYMGSTRSEAQHPAIDVANSIGTKIPSLSDGKIIQVVSGKKQGDPAYGNYIIVQDAQGQKFQYSHLSTENVKVGDTVKKGQIIAGMGNSGNTYSVSGGSASHLDLRIKDAAGRYLNPWSFI